MSELPTSAPPDEHVLVERLRAGDEAAFSELVSRYQPSLVRVARQYVASDDVAEEVAQEAWLGLLRGIDRFEGRSSLRTWLFRIVMNLARTRGGREARTLPFSSLADRGDEPAVDPERFVPAGDVWAGHWASPPRPWSRSAEQIALEDESLARIRAAIAMLPPTQREVITLRDVEGWDSEDVCNVLGISAVNQRVLLHRARARVRSSLEDYLTT